LALLIQVNALRQVCKPNDGSNPNADSPFNPALLPFDLTRGGVEFTIGVEFRYYGHTDVKEPGRVLNAEA